MLLHRHYLSMRFAYCFIMLTGMGKNSYKINPVYHLSNLVTHQCGEALWPFLKCVVCFKYVQDCSNVQNCREVDRLSRWEISSSCFTFHIHCYHYSVLALCKTYLLGSQSYCQLNRNMVRNWLKRGIWHRDVDLYTFC